MKKIILILVLFSSNIGNSAAAGIKSATTPINGSYNISALSVCIADSQYAGGMAGMPFYSNESSGIGSFTFTPNTTSYSVANSTAALSSWSTSFPGIPNPTALLTNTIPDPTSPSNTLVETPVQWGSSSLIYNVITYTLPTSSQTSISRSVNSNQPFFMTSFVYKAPSNNNGITTGYAQYLYNQSSNSWARQNVNFTTPATSLATNEVFIGLGPPLIVNNFTYNCSIKGSVFK